MLLEMPLLFRIFDLLGIIPAYSYPVMTKITDIATWTACTLLSISGSLAGENPPLTAPGAAVEAETQTVTRNVDGQITGFSTVKTKRIEYRETVTDTYKTNKVGLLVLTVRTTVRTDITGSSLTLIEKKPVDGAGLALVEERFLVIDANGNKQFTHKKRGPLGQIRLVARTRTSIVDDHVIVEKERLSPKGQLMLTSKSDKWTDENRHIMLNTYTPIGGALTHTTQTDTYTAPSGTTTVLTRRRSGSGSLALSQRVLITRDPSGSTTQTVELRNSHGKMVAIKEREKTNTHIAVDKL